MTFGKDSIGRSDVYHNPYDVRHVSNPSVKKFRAEQSSLDTLATSQAKLEKEIYQKMQNSALNPPNGGLVFVFYVGKGVFYILMVPPYFFFYAMPRWVLSQGSSAMLAFMKKMNRHAKELYQEIILAQIRALAAKLAARMERMGRGIGHIFSIPAEALKALKARADNFKNLVTENLERWAKTASTPFKKGAEFALKTQEQLAAFLRNLMPSIPEVSNPFNPITEALREWTEKGNALAEKTGKSIAETTEKFIFNPLKALGNQFAESAKKVLEPVSKARKAATEKVESLSEKLSETLRKHVVSRVEHVIQRTSETAMPLVQSVTETIQYLPQPVINFFVPVFTVAKGSVRVPIHFAKGAKKAAEKMKQWSKSASKWTLAQVKKGLHYLAKGIILLHEKTLDLLWKIWRFLCIAFVITLEATKRFFFLLRLLFAWTKVLLKFSFSQLKLIME